jgi:density-regulated protein DRP1
VAKETKAAAAKAKAGGNAAPTTETPAATPEDGVAPLAEAKEKKEKAEEGDSDEDDEGELTFTDITPTTTTTASGSKQEITIQVNERTKRKRVTIVAGVESFGINPKDLAKQFAKKFATSASAGDEGIVMNGDLLYDIPDFLLENYPNVQKSALIRIEKGGIRKKIF